MFDAEYAPYEAKCTRSAREMHKTASIVVVLGHGTNLHRVSSGRVYRASFHWQSILRQGHDSKSSLPLLVWHVSGLLLASKASEPVTPHEHTLCAVFAALCSVQTTLC
eukprot:13752-Heterococcus_DN1.PRE.1